MCNCKPNNNNKCACQKYKKVNCSCVSPSTDYEKCENLASKSRELYEQALCCNKKIEKYATMAAQAECRAKQLEKEAQAAWCEYKHLSQQANDIACKSEALMKQSCKLLEQAQQCYSNANSDNDNSNCNCNCNW